MKVSLNIVKQYIDFELPPVDELVKRINEQLGGVEEVIDLNAKYKDAVIVKIVSAEKHPNADRLRVCMIDDGGKVADVPRDDDRLVQVVCGAPNAEAGKMVVWLPPKSTVPSSFDEKELFVLDARELRGILSQGMLAAADELAIGSDHEGILEINTDEWKPGDIEIKPGANFAEVYGLNDTIIDIENKMFTHRPDLFGQLGVAREIAGILGHKFYSPSWYLDTPTFENANGLELDVFNDAGEKVPRFMAVVLKNIEIKPSPLWLQCALVSMGSKPINNIVDVTNYVMLLTAQPTHAYDYDKLRGHKIGARMAKSGEKVTLLNHKEYELDETDIVIVDGEGPVGLAGIMGGGESEVDENTKNIVLEVATFDMYTVRKSSMRHGVFTDALTRFNKGQSPLQNDHILSLLMMSIKDVSNAEQTSNVFDFVSGVLRSESVDSKKPCIFDWHNLKAVLYADPDFINDRLGTTLNKDDIIRALSNVEIEAYVQPHPKGEDSVEIKTPFWRTDIELSEDIVEEVGRLYGFDKLPRELPKRSVKPASENSQIIAEQRVRKSMLRAGANEVLTYSFVHKNLMKKAGQDSAQAFELTNALSPDLQYYRLSLTPSLLDKIHSNVKAGHDEFALYEIGKAHHVNEYDEEGLPQEFGRVGLVYTNKKPAKDTGSVYYKAKRFATVLLADFGGMRGVSFVRLAEFDFGDHDAMRQMCAPYQPHRSAILMRDNRPIGVVGEYTTSVMRAFKLPMHTAGFELFLSAFVRPSTKNYLPLSKYPSISQDISLKMNSNVAYKDIFTEAWHAAGTVQPENTIPTLGPRNIYMADNSDEKTITLRLSVVATDRTLTDADVAPMLDAIACACHEKFDATRI